MQDIYKFEEMLQRAMAGFKGPPNRLIAEAGENLIIKYSKSLTKP